jgi:hypothetical protein
MHGPSEPSTASLHQWRQADRVSERLVGDEVGESRLYRHGPARRCDSSAIESRRSRFRSPTLSVKPISIETLMPIVNTEMTRCDVGKRKAVSDRQTSPSRCAASRTPPPNNPHRSRERAAMALTTPPGVFGDPVVTPRRTVLLRAWSDERAAARSARSGGDLPCEWRHLERAHILSQPMAVPHLRTHVAMLGYGIRRRDRREVVGQVLRLVVAAPGSWTGLPGREHRWRQRQCASAYAHS